MTLVKVKGFQIFRDRHGKLRCYHRATRHKIDLDKTPIGSVAFFSECARITAIIESQKAQVAKPCALGGLIKTYFQTAHFKNLSDATKRDYR